MFHYSRAVLRVGPRLLGACLFTFSRWNKHLDKVPFAIRNAKFRKLSKQIADALHVDLNIFGLENIPTEEANELKAKLEEAGAEVELA